MQVTVELVSACGLLLVVNPVLAAPLCAQDFRSSAGPVKSLVLRCEIGSGVSCSGVGDTKRMLCS